MQNKRLLIIFLIVFVDLLGFGLILPLLPYYAETFGANPTVIGLLVASYAAAQLIGAALLGRLSDLYGRRPLLLLSLFGTFIGFVILGSAHALWMLFAARIVDGFTGGNISIAQAYISDVTDDKNRARGLGLIGAAFGLGFIIGPALGGMLSQWGYAVPAFAAAGLSLLNLTAVAVFLPESLTLQQRERSASQHRPAFDFRSMRQALTRPLVGPLIYTLFFYGLASATFQSIFSLYALYHLNLNAQSTGYVLAYVGILAVLVQGGAIGWLTARIGENMLILEAVALMSLSLLAWAFVSNVPLLLVVLLPLSLATGVLNTVLRSALSKSVSREEIGGIMGFSASVESLTRVIAPSLGGFLLQQVGAGAPGVFGAVVTALLVPYIWRRLAGLSARPLAQQTEVPPS